MPMISGVSQPCSLLILNKIIFFKQWFTKVRRCKQRLYLSATLTNTRYYSWGITTQQFFISTTLPIYKPFCKYYFKCKSRLTTSFSMKDDKLNNSKLAQGKDLKKLDYRRNLLKIWIPAIKIIPQSGDHVCITSTVMGKW